MTNTNIWDEYPQELLDEAEVSRTEAEAQLLNKEPCDPDPYNVPLLTLLSRWWGRRN